MSNLAIELNDDMAADAVLGGVLIDCEQLLFLKPKPKASDFEYHWRRQLFEILEFLFERDKAIDLVTVCNEIDVRNLSDITELNPGNIVDLINATPTSIHTQHYANIVLKYSKLRQGIETATKYVQKLYDSKSLASETINEFILELMEINAGSQKSDLEKASTLNQGMYKRHKLARENGGMTGYLTGIKQLDRESGGLQSGDLVILAARPGTGKSSLGLDLALKAASRGIGRGKTVAIFTLEVTNERVHNNIIAHLSGVNSINVWSGNLTSDESWQVDQAAILLEKHEVYIDETPGISIVELRTKCIRFKAIQGELSLVIVDYVQLMTGDGRFENRQAEVSYITKKLKELAKELKVPILGLAQLNRSVESRKGPPILSDLRESGSIEQDADTVVFLHYTDEESKKAGILDAITAKQRNGPTGICNIIHDKQTSRFTDPGIESVIQDALAGTVHKSNGHSGNGNGYTPEPSQNGHRHDEIPFA